MFGVLGMYDLFNDITGLALKGEGSEFLCQVNRVLVFIFYIYINKIFTRISVSLANKINICDLYSHKC